MTTIEDDIYRRDLADRFRYKTPNKILTIIAEETLGHKGYEVFFDFERNFLSLSRRNGSTKIPINITYYDRTKEIFENNSHNSYIIYYSERDYEEDARLLADSIKRELNIQFTISPKKKSNNTNEINKNNESYSNGNGNH